VRLKNLGHISYTSRVIAHFTLKFPNFRYHGNRLERYGPAEDTGTEQQINGVIFFYSTKILKQK